MGDLLYPAIPDPVATTESLLDSVVTLKHNVELLTGSRKGDGRAKAVTAGDLVAVFAPGPGVGGGAPPPIDFANVNAALVVARAAVRSALSELQDVINTSTEDLQNEQQEAITELQLLLEQEEGLRIDGDTVLQTQIDTIILTNNEGAIAAIAVETAARITADTALAGQITSLSATVNGNSAAISNEVLARANADSALASQINTVTAIASSQHVFVQSTAPTALQIGDIWIDTANGNLLKVWDGGAWVARPDAQMGINAAAISTETIARANADSAIANQITTLVATVQNNTAAITQETLTRATADEAIAVEIDTLTASVGGNAASIANEAAVRANADSALAGQITTLQTQTANNAASITAEQVARTSGDSALAGQITTLSATVTTVQGNVNDNTTAIAANTASITNEAVVRATADNAFAAQISALNSSVGNANAAITAEATTRAANDNAISANVSNLTATVSSQGTLINNNAAAIVTNSAAITSEQTARANADTAIANSVTSLSATVSSNTSSISANAAAIATEQTARVNGDSALAGSISSLTTTVNGNTASIATQQTSINGLMAEYSLTLNVNGHISGFRINNDSLAGSQFIVQADTFKIVSGSGGTLFTPFVVTGPNVFINRVVVNDEIVSPSYTQDPSGNPASGFRAGNDGLLRAYDGRFTDLQARGGTFKERPLLLDVPNFRNGVPEGLPSVRWVSPGTIAGLGGPQVVSLFSRTPDCVTLSVVQGGTGGDYNVIQTFMVPPGHRLPPRMVADLIGQTAYYVWNENGTIDLIDIDGNGAIVATTPASGKWMFDVERDPLILSPNSSNKYICGLGYTRYAQPLRIPEFLFNGSTLVTSVSFKCWGAGGAHDENAGGQGGPGGYVAGSFTVSGRAGTGFLKHGDMIYLLPGEGGKSKAGDVIFGFGGPGQAQDSRSSGGGLSGVFKYSVTRANAMLIAGGGGAQSNAANGGPGGAALSGGNGVVSGTDAQFMTGLPWFFNGTNQCAGGGGGYQGGGYLAVVSSRRAGAGGTNFVHASASSVTNSSSAVSGTGNSTTATPPNSADTDLAANDDCLGNTALAGRGKTVTTQAQQGGNGLIVVSFT